MSDDKYPSESGRRRFVKGVVGSAALAGVGVGGAATLDLATQPEGGGGGITPYVGISRTGGPAPRGMPYIPVEIGDDGTLSGLWPEVEEVTEAGQTFEVARTDIGGRTYSSEWFQYCGRQQAEGVQPSADQDNQFLAASGAYDWQSEELEEGEPIKVEHFEDYKDWGNEIGDAGVGKPAEATWRSQETDDVLPVTVIRSQQIEEAAEGDGDGAQWYSEAAPDGFIAYLNVCTHFCCVPGYKTSNDSPKYDAENGIYCQCHQSTYDPFTPEFGTFVALPRPEGEETSGRGGSAGGGGGGDEGGEGGGGEGGEGGGGGNESDGGGNESDDGGGNESSAGGGGNESGGGGNESSGGNESDGGEGGA